MFTDIDECSEKNFICQNGECNNFQGSFQCMCLPGYQLTPFRDNCVDIDECQRHPNTCNNGTCMNSIGSYSCHCYPGFKLSPNNDCIGRCVSWLVCIMSQNVGFVLLFLQMWMSAEQCHSYVGMVDVEILLDHLLATASTAMSWLLMEWIAGMSMNAWR